MSQRVLLFAVSFYLFCPGVANAQDVPPPDILRTIVGKLEARPAPTAVVFQRPASAPETDNVCRLQHFDMVLTRNDRPVRTYSVMLDMARPRQFFAVLTRIAVDADGSSRAYHPEDPEGEGTCWHVGDRLEGVCALDKFSSGRILLFRGAERMTKAELVSEWHDIWPLIRDKRLKSIDLRAAAGPDAPEGYYFFHWRARNLTAFFRSTIVPMTNDGYPCVHGRDSNHPGYFVAATTLTRNATARADGCAPARYLDAEEIPFFVLPKGGFGDIGIGDVMVARLKRDGMDSTVYGIVGDAGPPHKLGEGSIALNAALLGKSGEPVLNMRETWALDIEGPPVAVLVLGGTRHLLNGDYSRSNIEQIARGEFARWGGGDPFRHLDACTARARINPK
jgi:hypothetical protein